MEERDQRTALLLGEEGVEKLKNSRVAVFGIGGVGSYAAEALVRAGVGTLCFVDKDVVEESNINRQLVALNSTVGQYKTAVMKARALDINPACKITEKTLFYLPETAGEVDLTSFDYIVDAIDNVTAKIHLICEAKRVCVPVVSAMGAGNKIRADMLRISDLAFTRVCPLARVMRRELNKRGVYGVKVVYSEEEPRQKGDTVGSLSYVPSVMGLMLAGEVIQDLVK